MKENHKISHYIYFFLNIIITNIKYKRINNESFFLVVVCCWSHIYFFLLLKIYEYMLVLLYIYPSVRKITVMNELKIIQFIRSIEIHRYARRLTASIIWIFYGYDWNVVESLTVQYLQLMWTISFFSLSNEVFTE